MATNFFWFIDGSVAGMERPGSYRGLDEDLAFLKESGIGIIISLTLAPLERAAAEDGDFELFHIPLPDGSAPGIDQIRRFVSYVDYGLSSRKKILVHCGAGHGRTGTMLACYLVSRGSSAPWAIAEVRRKNPHAIETSAQERSVSEYERYLRKKEEPRRDGEKRSRG